MHRLTKEVVVAEFETGGKDTPSEAMFKAIGRDYKPDTEHALYRMEGLEVSVLNRDMMEVRENG